MKITRPKTSTLKKKDVNRQWLLIDAQDRVLGQLASEIATKLMGKHKPTYTPNIDDGDYVVLTNASGIVLTGSKATKKMYARHSNYPGGFTSENFATLLARDPDAVIRTAVKGMLPANKLRDARLARLKVFAGSDHTYHNYIKD